MEPEMMGALLGAGAGVFVGVLALYGALRQAQAARRAAEVAARAAEQAAETAAVATQQATDRAVEAAYGQWRHTSRRDAALAFALAADEAVQVATDLENGWHNVTQESEEVAYRAMFRALAVVDAEGPEPLLQRARMIADAVAVVSEYAVTLHLEVADGLAERRLPGSAHSPDNAMLLNRLVRARHEFRAAVRAYLDDPETPLPQLSWPDEWSYEGPYAVIDPGVRR
ncbi:hypothetical protein [Streptomyces sp. NPDC058548]|uniref:hypothetical protein n=1 Tax=Streptomyces sp. NPDC058548 TaxID=3346545 RepID=UPI00364A6BAC